MPNFCPNCGKQLDPEWIHCVECGYRLIPAIPQNNPQNTQYPQIPYANYPYKKKSKWWICCLILLFTPIIFFIFAVVLVTYLIVFYWYLLIPGIVLVIYLVRRNPKIQYRLRDIKNNKKLKQYIILHRTFHILSYIPCCLLFYFIPRYINSYKCEQEGTCIPGTPSAVEFFWYLVFTIILIIFILLSVFFAILSNDIKKEEGNPIHIFNIPTLLIGIYFLVIWNIYLMNLFGYIIYRSFESPVNSNFR